MNSQIRSLTADKERLAIEGGVPVRPKENFLVFGAPVIEEQEIEEVVDSMRKRWIGTGPKVAQFEKDFAHLKQKKACRCAEFRYSGTASVHARLRCATGR